jgi:hypothetical protein
MRAARQLLGRTPSIDLHALEIRARRAGASVSAIRPYDPDVALEVSSVRFLTKSAASTTRPANPSAQNRFRAILNGRRHAHRGDSRNRQIHLAALRDGIATALRLSAWESADDRRHRRTLRNRTRRGRAENTWRRAAASGGDPPREWNVGARRVRTIDRAGPLSSGAAVARPYTTPADAPHGACGSWLLWSRTSWRPPLRRRARLSDVNQACAQAAAGRPHRASTFPAIRRRER